MMLLYCIERKEEKEGPILGFEHQRAILDSILKGLELSDILISNLPSV